MSKERKLAVLIFVVFLGSSGSAVNLNVTNITIHEVTGLSPAQKEVSGTLVDHGLNKTFQLGQRAEEREYRFTFHVENKGGADWTLENADELFHDGLNETWTVSKIWYNISADYDGGSFASGRVSWDTGLGGSLAAGDTLYAKYLVNISLNRSGSYRQNFTANDTSGNNYTRDLHGLNTTKWGFLDVDLLEPPNDTVVQQNRTFVLNASVACREGECGQVALSARYNQSVDAADTLVPEASTRPFHTNNTNTRVCSPDLGFNQSCFIAWDVNATGNLGSWHLVDANASSTSSYVSRNDSVDHLIQINKIILMDLAWSVIDFGTLRPGDRNQSANGNAGYQYNVSFDSIGSSVDDLWVRATDLESNKLNYTIPAENLSIGLENDINNETSLTNSYRHLRSNVPAGTNVTTFYWIDVPFGIYNGGYSGEIFFKANSTTGG
ncbi:MAG: hypothetical protein ABEI58_04135 [Candidatus Nanohaloarchaea archaeon]